MADTDTDDLAVGDTVTVAGLPGTWRVRLFWDADTVGVYGGGHTPYGRNRHHAVRRTSVRRATARGGTVTKRGRRRKG